MKKKQQEKNSFSSKPKKMSKSSKKLQASRKKSQATNQTKTKNVKKTHKKSYSVRLIVKDISLALVGGMLLTTVLLSFFLSIVKVNGFGMIPILRDQEIVLVQKNKEIKRFDLIAFSRGDKLEIRRVIGLPGDRIRYDKDTLLINDESITEKFIVDEINESQKNGKNLTEDFSTGGQELSKGNYLVLGDNRPYATDSRHYGYVYQEKIVGVVKMKLLPFEYI